jgi:hypothetical protein
LFFVFNSKIKVSSEESELPKTLSSFDFTPVLQAVKIIVNDRKIINFFIIKLVYTSNLRNISLTYLRGLELTELKEEELPIV